MFRVSGLVNDSIVDGPGLRLAVFTQGCCHRCPGCHNPQTHALDGGYEISAEEVLDKVRRNPLLDGITLTGGEPFLQADALVPLAKGVKELGLHVMAYSGFTFDELLEQADTRRLLEYCDILVDGPFLLEERSLELKFRGSRNQRIIDVPSSLEGGRTVLANL
ncbi:MAG: anaerobic ribonucleoside-triphosphate reductase activating protein [Clostridiales bacterium]|nr:anaerobic ribonucleoside-triphosphate reductase activating protein [Clostridiales bacterium]